MAFMPITGRLEQTASCDFHRVLDAVQVHVADEACSNVGHDLEFTRFAFSSLSVKLLKTRVQKWFQTPPKPMEALGRVQVAPVRVRHQERVWSAK
jgi:hypothetical protein